MAECLQIDSEPVEKISRNLTAITINCSVAYRDDVCSQKRRGAPTGSSPLHQLRRSHQTWHQSFRQPYQSFSSKAQVCLVDPLVRDNSL